MAAALNFAGLGALYPGGHGLVEFYQPARGKDIIPSGLPELGDRFLLYMRDKRGPSFRAIQVYRWHVEKFLRYLHSQDRSFSEVTIADTDTFLMSLRERKWCRVSLATSVKALRGFFRYAAQRCWCSVNIAIGMIGPRLFPRGRGLPIGPGWNDVQRLISSTRGNTPRDLRDNAILQLFAVYGFRSGEVAAVSKT